MASVDLQLVCLRRSAPLSADEFGLVKSESLAACRLPTQSRLREPALSGLLREVKVDVVKGLPGRVLTIAPHMVSEGAPCADPRTSRQSRWYDAQSAVIEYTRK